MNVIEQAKKLETTGMFRDLGASYDGSIRWLEHLPTGDTLVISNDERKWIKRNQPEQAAN
jgi:hypothetical protein